MGGSLLAAPLNEAKSILNTILQRGTKAEKTKTVSYENRQVQTSLGTILYHCAITRKKGMEDLL